MVSNPPRPLNRTSRRSLWLMPFVYGLMILSSGCIERHYSYKMNLDGSCEFTYEAKGDSADIYDPVGSYPESPFFNVTTRHETDDSGRTSFVLEAKALFHHDTIPAVLGLREVPWTEILLHHPAKFSHTDFFLFNRYHFQLTFVGRKRDAIEGDRWRYIPDECRVLESGKDSLLSEEERATLEEKYAAGMILWNLERYRMRLHEIIRRSLALHPEIKISPAWIDSANADLDSLLDLHFRAVQYLAAEKKLDQISLEWWKDLEPAAQQIILENLNIIGDAALANEILRVSQLLEMQHQVSEDLSDESFEIRLDMPGRVTHSNSQTMEKGVLVWKYIGEDFAADDLVLEASSLYLFPVRIAGALVFLILLILAIRSRRRKSAAEAGPPPPPFPRK